MILQVQNGTGLIVNTAEYSAQKESIPVRFYQTIIEADAETALKIILIKYR